MKVIQNRISVTIEDELGNKIKITTNTDGIVVENLSDGSCEYQDKENKHRLMFKGPDPIMCWKDFELMIR